MSLLGLRYRLSYLLFDLAARVHPPLRVRSKSVAHHVGNVWLEWRLSK